MNTKTMMTIAVVLTAGIGAQAATTGIRTVADEISVQLHNAHNATNKTTHAHWELAATNTVNTVTAVQAAEYPTSVTAPAFWVDCSDTTGWHFATESGKQVVTNIPSRQGSKWTGVRWLTTRPGGGDWVGWGTAEGKQDKLPLPPFYATNTTGALGNGGRYLEFGGERRSLLFNTDGCGYNALTNIGTVIAVWGSDVRNGGHLLGGGATGGTLDYGWHRAGDFVTASGAYASSYRWSAYVMNGNAQAAAKNGYLWHDGTLSSPQFAGYNGGWEVLSLQCTAATAQACGIGVNDKRWNMNWVSGGQEIAEVLIYDEVLARADIEKVEIYLEQKWFGRKHTGWNGKARVGVVNAYDSKFASEIRVPEGETLEIDRLTGGTGSSGAAATKTGAGTLVFAGEGAQKYASDIVLKEGTLSYPALKATPTAATLPAHLYARFDASDASSRTADGDGKVAKWANLAPTADAKRFNKPFALMQNTVSRRPTVMEDELGDGLDVLDFGIVNKTANNAGQCLFFTTNATAVIEGGSNNAIGIHGIQTVVLLLGAHNGGGTLFSSSDLAYERDYPDAADSFHRPLLCKTISSSNPVIKGSDCRMWIDGQRWDPSLGYAHPGYQVVALQMPGNYWDKSGITALFRSARNYGSKDLAGGGRIGELLMWNRALTEEELLDAQAYLMAKWLKRDAPGYARAADQFVALDLQNLNVPGGSRVTLDVGAGRTIRIGKLTVGGELVKTGEGTVEVEQASYLYDGHVTTKAGAVTAVGVRDVASAAELAPGASLHLDVTQTNRMVTGVESGETRIRTWSDSEGRIGAWSQYSTAYRNQGIGKAPALTTVENGLNGYSVANFKTFSSSGRYMLFERPLHAIRSVYAVVKYPGYVDSQGLKLGFLMGTGSGRNEDGGGSRLNFYPWEDVDDITFHPGLTGSKWDGRLFGYSSGVFDGEGNCRTNGVQVADSKNLYVATNCFQLIELHPKWPVPAAQIGLDRDVADRLGGFQLAEIVLYERQLSEREKVATRNHLMQKWFDKEYSDPLPDAPAKPEIRYYEIEVDGEKTFENDTDEEKVRVTGEGTLTKTGEGTLTVKDLSAFDGTVNVNEGTLEVLYADPYATPYLPADGILYHADATKGITATTNANNVICVSKWANQGSAPLKAVASGGYSDYYRVLFDADVGYRPTVDINGYNACMVWNKSDGSSTDIQTLSGIKSIFWLIGSQNGGGWMMGGGTNKTGALSHMWHRGIYYPNWPETKPNYVGNTNICTVLNGNMQAAAQPPNANWWKNGETMGWSDYLSGKWDQLSMIVADDTKDVNASGFAFDGRSRKASEATNHEYNGHQRIAEIICYDRRVSDEERQQIECYLRCKWLNNMHAAAANVVVNVAEGATLKLGGAQTFAGITGKGTVEGEVILSAFATDYAAKEAFAVDGTLTIGANPTVDVSNLATFHGYEEVTLATATAFEGLDNLQDATFTGVPSGTAARLSVKNGKLVLRLGRRGMVIFFH